MNAASSTSSSPYSPFASPYSRHNMDRDVLAQRALLGEDAYLTELESPSPLATPSPMIKQLSPLTVASHLQDLQHNPFLDEYDAGREPLSVPAAAPPSVKRDPTPPHRSSLRSSSTMTSSGLGLDFQIDDSRTSIVSYIVNCPHDLPAPIERKEHSRPARQALEPASVTLPTIQETDSSSPSSRRRTKPATMNTYPLPPSSYVSSPASPTPTWRRPSPFPLGPVPPQLPPRRVRYEPQPHIVDVAVERFNINTRTISSSPVASKPATASSALDQERQRQWQQWEAERIRSLEMTREAAKNNRVQAPSSSASSSNRTTSSVSEAKVTPASTKKSKGKWWCFGGGAIESDHEEVNEKQQFGNPNRRSISSLEAVDVDEDVEEDEEEWSEARAASGTGYVSSFDQTAQILIFRCPRLLSNFGFSCAKSSSRRRATLKKKTY
jgi:hypothetical protein